MNITVVGAGIVGCAIAHELASRGARVRVLDGRGVGRGATYASAGMLAPYIEGHSAPLRTLGISSLALFDRFVQRISTDSGESIEYERTGTLQVAADAAEAAELDALAGTLRDGGVEHRLLDATEVRRLVPQICDDVRAGLHVPEHGYVAVGALTRAAAAAAMALGATFSTSRVESLDALGADAVIVSAGSWSGALSRVTTAIKPIRGQLLQLRLDARPTSQIVWGSGCYLVPWRDGTVLAGATVEDVGFNETPTAAGVQQLLSAAVALMPPLGGAAFEEVRAGLRPMTHDELPVVGASSTMRGVFHATGHYRNGVLLAPLTAALIADLVLDGREGPELALMRPRRVGL